MKQKAFTLIELLVAAFYQALGNGAAISVTMSVTTK